ncbi:MAG: hypothetical protein ACERKK_10725 [Poseidonibacter sp.]|uniref:hypothetical protein n=1 Tax=Poseidonibacter sp. TaxID=2321188 RepID=UPI00359D7F35
MSKINKLLFLLFLQSSLFAVDDFTIDKLLTDIEKKTDLSSKTKLENGGISTIYTRDDINRMQVKSLKDILKLTRNVGYTENRYGLPDSLYQGSTQPFLSSTIRVFIDNQEITTSLYGSGLIILGDIDMGFVDHVEVYTQNPSFEFSTEPTYALIKLYSKKALKDEGGKISISKGSYGSSNISGYYSQELEKDWAYFVYLSLNDDKRKKYYSNNQKLSRDKKVSHLLASFYNDKSSILFEAISSNRDSFVDASTDASANLAKIEHQSIFLGYDYKNSNFSFLTSYGYMNTQTDFKDDNQTLYSQETKTDSHVYTNELKYNFNAQNNKLLTGVKYRFKKFDYEKLDVNNISKTSNNYDYQAVSTVFIENQYSLKENSIITTGVEYIDVKNNHSIQQDELLLYRVGHTYTTNNWTNKLINSHIETSLEPYLVNSENKFITAGYIKPQEINSIIENIIYEKDNKKYEIILDYTKIKNYLSLSTNNTTLLNNYEKDVFFKSATFNLTYKYNSYDKFLLSLRHLKTQNMPNSNDGKYSTLILRNINTYEKFDVYNELIFSNNNIDNKNYYDYTLAIKYNYTKDFNISLKGENLFSKAKTTNYDRVDPATSLSQSDLNISSIDKKIILSMEYLF